MLRKITRFIVISLFIPLSFSQSVFATDTTYDQTFYGLNNIDFYNPTACSNGSSTTTSTPSTTGNGIYNITITNPRGSQFHGSNYAFEDSLDGVEYAHTHNYNSIDLDINKSKERILFAAHDPSLVGKPWATIEAGNSGRQYKVSQLSDLLTKTAQYGIQANLDLKPWGNTWDDATFAEIANLANSLNAQVAIKASTNDPNLANALSLAQNHGFWVRSNSGTYNGKDLSGNGWKPGVWVPPSTSHSGATAQPVSSVSGNSCACSSASTSSVSLPGSDNAEKTWNYFIGKGLSPVAAAGIMGNLAQEHGFQTSDTPGGLGIAQWIGGRRDELMKKTNYTDIGVQLDFLWGELTTSYSKVLTNLKTTTTSDEATNIFVGPDEYPSGTPAPPTYEGRRQGGFENPGTPMMLNRLKAAQLALSQYSGSASTSSSDSTLTSAQACGSTANGAVTGNIIQTAMNYAWPTYHAGPYLNEKPSYAAAIQKAQAAGKYVGGLSHPGVDCGGFITRVMQDSGVDPNYGGGGNTTVQLNYLKSHSNLYQQIHPNSTADLQPGDIAIKTDNGGHTYMYIGKQVGFQTSVVSASVAISNPDAWRAPMSSMEKPADPAYQWFRYIGNGGDSTNV